MNILFYDTETTGLPVKGRDIPIERQPHVLQLGLSLYDSSRRPIFEISTLVHPEEGEDFTISPEAYETHGITKEMVMDLGVRRKTAIGMLRFACGVADRAYAHNAQFDKKLLGYTCYRSGYGLPKQIASSGCTADLTTDILNLPPTPKMIAAGFNKPKRPKLEECYRFFFDEELSGAHDALVDTRGCARVFFHVLDNYPHLFE